MSDSPAADAVPLVDRRTVLTTLGLLGGAGALGVGAGRLMAAPEDAPTVQPESRTQQRRRRAAIKRGCSWLAEQQNLDGTWGDPQVFVALTSLSVLALMADGSTDSRGPHGAPVRLGLDWLSGLIRNRNPNSRFHEGYFHHPHDHTSRMHGQGFATLALASALGTAGAKRHRELRSVLEKAVACCEYSQTGTGGYGYQPNPRGDHEGSVTVTVAQGLRAARDAGLAIDATVVDNALEYLRQSQNADGGFKYSRHQNQTTYALTAAALSSFYLFGQYKDSPERIIERGFDYMRRQLRTRGVRQSWYYYGHFYAAWAYWQRDGGNWDPRETEWGAWQKEVYPDLLSRQTGDGSFSEEGSKFDYGPILTTAFAVLTLAIPDEVLPIFQR